MKQYLIDKSIEKLDIGQTSKFKDHLDNCMACWFTWNKVRWDTAMDSRGMRELKKYLGKKFIPYYDSSWAIAAKWNELNPTTADEISEFYKQAEEYIYNLVIWHESGDRENFSAHLKLLSKQFAFKSVLDYGCGVGTDGLWLCENGYKVNFIDYQCPSVDFLKWRMKQRGIRSMVIDVKKLKKFPAFDMFWAIDVLEHLPDPLEVVRKLNKHTYLFVHRSQFNDLAGGRHPCHISFNELRLSRALKKLGFSHVPWRQLSVWVKKV